MIILCCQEHLIFHVTASYHARRLLAVDCSSPGSQIPWYGVIAAYVKSRFFQNVTFQNGCVGVPIIFEV